MITVEQFDPTTIERLKTIATKAQPALDFLAQQGAQLAAQIQAATYAASIPQL